MIPQVTSLSPSEGACAGGELVRVVGAGFAGEVLVEFGGEPAAAARAWTIAGISYADVRVPPRASGLVDVVLRNLAGGVPVPGESVTVPDAWRYWPARLARRPDQAETGDAGVLEVLRALIASLQTAVVRNAGTPTSVDYDETTADGLAMVYMAQLPSVVIHNLRMVRTRDDSANVYTEEPDAGDVLRRRRPMFVDLELQLTGAAIGVAQTLNLAAALASYFQRTPWLEVPVAGSDPVRFEMDLVDDARVSLRSGGKGGDVKAFSWSFAVRGVGLGDAVPLDRTHGVDETVIQSEAMP